MIRLISGMLAVAVIISVSSPPVSAQGITGGLKTGLNHANFRGETIGLTKSRVGFTAGGFVTFRINETFSIQPEVYYTVKGFRQKVRGAFESTITLDYLEIPVLAKYSSETQNNVKISLFAGPAFEFNLKSKTNIKPEGGIEEEKDLDTKGFDYGLVLGLEVSIDVYYCKIIIESRYTLGLMIINKDWRNNPGGEDFEVKNSVLSLLVGFSF